MWDPAQYARYSDDRSRPFYDLVARVLADDPQLVVDLGCGPGELTASLTRRWPDARIVGVDNSAAMLEKAAACATDNVTFVHGDLSTYLPDEAADVVVSNAAYQWIEDNPRLLGEIAQRLRPGGWLAIQVPGNFRAASHEIIRGLARSQKWAPRLRGVTLREDPVLDAAGYGELFAAAGLQIDTWETTYNHVLPGDDPVLEWVSGSALRPILDALDEHGRAEFRSDLAPVLRDAYPKGSAGTIFPFRRIFAVGHRP